MPVPAQASDAKPTPLETATDFGDPSLEIVGKPFTRTLEAPGLRLKLPTAIADAIGKIVMVLSLRVGDQAWLAVIPVAQWRAIVREEIMSESLAAVDRQTYLRKLADDARRVELSRDGRLTLPKDLAARCGIESEVTIFPRLDRLEIVAGKAKLEDVKPHLYHQFQGGVPGLL